MASLFRAVKFLVRPAAPLRAGHAVAGGEFAQQVELAAPGKAYSLIGTAMGSYLHI